MRTKWKPGNVVRIAESGPKEDPWYLELVLQDGIGFLWYADDRDVEVSAPSIDEAVRRGRRHFREDGGLRKLRVPDHGQD